MKNSLKTRAEFAWLCKVSRAAITKALAVGNIISADGKYIDPDNKINSYFYSKSIAKAPLRAARKAWKAKEKEALESVKQFPANDKFIAIMEKLNADMPKTKSEKIQNDVSFELVSLFAAFNGWTNGGLDQDWLVEKCILWGKSMSEIVGSK